MLIKRNEKGNKIEVLYDSSNILASSWDKTTNNLKITFKRGAQYLYKNVKNTDYIRFELAESQGKELNNKIKNEYKYEKLGDIEPNELIKEIHDYQNKEMDGIEKGLITTLKSFIEVYEDKQSIDYEKLGDIKYFIDKINARNKG